MTMRREYFAAMKGMIILMFKPFVKSSNL